MCKIRVLTPESQAKFEAYQKFNEQNLLRYIRQVNRLVNSEISRCVEAKGYKDLSSRHLSVLDNVDLTGTNIVTLANRAGITKQAMSKLVKELVTQGLVEVVQDKKDSRVLLVFVTNIATELMHDLSVCIKAVREDRKKMNLFSDADYSASIKHMEDMVRYYEYINSERTGRDTINQFIEETAAVA